MKNFWIRSLRATVSLPLFFLHLLLMSVPFFIVSLAKLCWPFERSQRFFEDLLIRIATLWTQGMDCLADLTQNIQWNVHLPKGLNHQGSYVLLANHQSWTDIFVLYRICRGQMPYLKIFVKKTVIWLPIVGQALWMLNFPFVQRRSQRQTKSSHLQDSNQEIVEKFCQAHRNHPTAVLIFAEGTRHQRPDNRPQNGPYRHLKAPKAGGLALVLKTIGHQLDALLDVTINYENGTKGFLDVFFGKVTGVSVVVKKYEIPKTLIGEAWSTDEKTYTQLQDWLKNIWRQKDQTLDTLCESTRM